MAVTDESQIANDSSDSEEDSYCYYPPREVLNTDLIETRVMTRSDTVPSSKKQIRETNQQTRSPADMLSASVGLEDKKETIFVEQQDEIFAPGRGMAQKFPVELTLFRTEKPLTRRDSTSDELTPKRSDSSSQRREGSATVESEAEVITEHREKDFLKVKRVASCDRSGPKDEALPILQNMAESPSEPNAINEYLPVSPVPLFSGSSTDAECLVTEPPKEPTGISPLIMGESESDPIPRRSQRHREQPERLQYHQLGNPLLSIAQSLFQGLNIAFADALQNHGYADVPQTVPRTIHSHMGVAGRTHL